MEHLFGYDLLEDNIVKSLDIRRLKQWIIKHLKPDSRLRDVILLEEDIMLPEEYLAKLDVWLKLYKIEKHAPDQTG